MSRKKKMLIISVVVIAVMAIGISSAFAVGGSSLGNRNGEVINTRLENRQGNGECNGDCDGTCDGTGLAPQDGTGNQYGNGQNGECDGTCDELGTAPQDGTGNKYGRTK